MDVCLRSARAKVWEPNNPRLGVTGDGVWEGNDIIIDIHSMSFPLRHSYICKRFNPIWHPVISTHFISYSSSVPGMATPSRQTYGRDREGRNKGVCCLVSRDCRVNCWKSKWGIIVFYWNANNFWMIISHNNKHIKRKTCHQHDAATQWPTVYLNKYETGAKTPTLTLHNKTKQNKTTPGLHSSVDRRDREMQRQLGARLQRRQCQ